MMLCQHIFDNYRVNYHVLIKMDGGTDGDGWMEMDLDGWRWIGMDGLMNRGMDS